MVEVVVFAVIVDRYEHLCHESSLSGCWAILRGKNFNILHYRQTVHSNFFIPVMLLDTIDFYHFIPLSLTLTLPGGHKVSAKQNLLASFSQNIFLLTMMKFDALV